MFDYRIFTIFSFPTIRMTMKHFFTLILCATLMTAGSFGLCAQDPIQRIVDQYLVEHHTALGLTHQDISAYTISDQYTSPHNQVTHVYLCQQYGQLDVYNAILNLNIHDGKVFHIGNRFVPNLAEAVVPVTDILSADVALQQVLKSLTGSSPAIVLRERKSQTHFVFENGEFAREPVEVKQIWQPVDGAVRLAWDMTLNMAGNPDMWSIRVDAQTGEILDQHNYTVYCRAHPLKRMDACDHDHQTTGYESQTASITSEPGSYNVFAEVVDGHLYLLESPSIGSRSVIQDPRSYTSGPYHWHDTNGDGEPNYTTTRGMSVQAYLDEDANNEPDAAGPDGGPTLTFNFPLDLAQNPDTYKEAAVTNLFFANKFMYDFAYAYGFNEESGNFQASNLGKGGLGGDEVRAEAHDGSGTNNANFSTPPDGAPGRMQMYLWDAGLSDRLVTVNSPASIAGAYKATTTSTTWGEPVSGTPVTAEVALAFDSQDNPSETDACEDVINPDELEGKIAIVDRGGCFFSEKAYRVQQAGAIGCIICNFNEDLISMGPGTFNELVDIPVVMLGNSACQLIKQQVAQGVVEVSLVIPNYNGPDQLDASLDNTVVGHEYTHGISNRLTGGPGNSGCLGNAEQMGEGWSDFISLAATVRPGDVGTTARGYGTYVNNEDLSGNGIRPFPYSTDMSVNPLTFSDAFDNDPAPYGVGNVWAATLWDLYWALIDAYGFDPDIFYGSGGNNIAMQLVMDGMKMQPCGPGMLDGRDAILMADQINYNGANQCIIWEVFARRGMGWFADQGNINSIGDELESFETRPSCIKEVKISKNVTPLIEAGETISVTLSVTNDKDETVTGLVVSDAIPQGASYVNGSASNGGTAQGDVVVFEVGSLASGASVSLTYQLASDPGLFSISQFKDDMEENNLTWLVEALQGEEKWTYTNSKPAYSGNFAWHVDYDQVTDDADSEQALQSVESFDVTGNQPVLRFYHNYDLRPSQDGGIIEISAEQGQRWERPDAEIFREGYERPVAYTTFAIPGIRAFSGNSGNYVASYVDLSPWAGEEILLRWRFGQSQDAVENPPNGWTLDDVEIMDMFNYHSEACLTTDQGDEACAFAPGRGTVVEPGIPTSDNELTIAQPGITPYPNPASDYLLVNIACHESGAGTLQLFTIDGKQVLQRQLNLRVGGQVQSIPLSAVAPGLYFLNVSTPNGTFVEKVIVQ